MLIKTKRSKAYQSKAKQSKQKRIHLYHQGHLLENKREKPARLEHGRQLAYITDPDYGHLWPLIDANPRMIRWRGGWLQMARKKGKKIKI
jgi:hypothetical protein